MPYHIVSLPVPSLNFREFSKEVLQNYYKWFIEQIPIRIAELELYVRENPTFIGWEADFSEASLEALGNWYVTQIETRPRSHEELKEIRNAIAFPVEINDWDFTTKTYSLMFDLGMYYGEALRKKMRI